MAPNKSKNKIEERRRQKRESEKRRREKIKADPIAYETAKAKERERYHKRRKQGKIKLIGEVSERQKRIQRSQWRKRSNNYRNKIKRINDLQRFINNSTPPNSPILGTPRTPDAQLDIAETPTNTPASTTSRKECGRKRVKRNRTALYRKCIKKDQEIEKLKKKYRNYKGKYYRLKKKVKSEIKKKNSPQSNVANMLEGTSGSTIKKKLIFAEAMSAQISRNYVTMKSSKQKSSFRMLMSGKILKKYRCLSEINKLLGRTKKQKAKQNENIYFRIKKAVHEFLEKDSSSRLGAGTKETVTYKKCKKQKRYLCDTLKNLYRQFCEENNEFKISYATFCKLRPFWVTIPKASARPTCLCLIHENMKLLVTKLKLLNIIELGDPDNLCSTICCSDMERICLERKCEKCHDKVIKIKEFDSEEKTSYQKWITRAEEVLLKGKTKICKKTVKEDIKCTKMDLVVNLFNTLEKYMQHKANIKNQFKAIDYLKANLKNDEVLIHIDYSENYNCKYAREIQSCHFGGSKAQITLHTVVWYYRAENGKLKPVSFCSLSESLRHDPVSVMAHLEKLFEYVKRTVLNLRSVHFLSDGPTTQYRNKSMFYLFATQISKILGVDFMTWNFSESGHGKGAPDGVGGLLKRTADLLVAHGKDITDLHTLVEELKKSCPNTVLDIVDASSIDKWEILPKELVAFSGTMKIHQLTWHKTRPYVLRARRLSCLECDCTMVCTHFHLGDIHIFQKQKLTYTEVYSDSDSEETTYMTNENQPSYNINVGDYVIAEWPISSKVYYVGEIQKVMKDKVELKFMRRKPSTKMKYLFVWPEKEDLEYVERSSIQQVLMSPAVLRRGRFYFNRLNFKMTSSIK